MTRYRVIILPEAEQNMRDAFDYIAARSPINAGKWLRGVHHQIGKLEVFPHGLGHAREQQFFEEELRQLVYKSYRIIYTVDDRSNTVIVLSVRHAKRRAIGN